MFTSDYIRIMAYICCTSLLHVVAKATAVKAIAFLNIVEKITASF